MTSCSAYIDRSDRDIQQEGQRSFVIIEDTD